MPEISKEIAYQSFRSAGSNSSHFVWFLTPLRFFATGNGCVFAYLRVGRVTVFALEPLLPATAGEDPASSELLGAAWAEVERELCPRISFFVSVYGPFFEFLRGQGFQGFQVGREPYVRLTDCIPTGKSGKGVRAARNQALRSGLEVKEYSGAELEAEPELLAELKKVLEQWKGRNVLELGGFLNTVDPFSITEGRRYFLARRAGSRLEGFIVATPIPGRNSFFLEDLVLRPSAARGAGELLTLEAMAALAESTAAFASLGVVALTCVTEESAHGLPPLAKFVVITLPKYAGRIYNVNGLETFRKRFKPHLWENVFLAMKNHAPEAASDSRAWLMSLGALLRSFRPRLRLSWVKVRETALEPFRRHLCSNLIVITSALSFILVNRGGELPKWALENYGFSGTAPWLHKLYLTITSDFLFFSPMHFYSSIFLFIFLLRWMERCFPRQFVALFLTLGIFFDDFVDQLVIITPFKLFKHRIFENMIAAHDVGPSLWISAAAGLMFGQLRKYREIAFAVVSVAVVLGLALSSSRYYMLVMNLNHFLFLTIGFVVEKLRFEYERSVSRKVAAQKPPVAKSVAAPRPHNAPRRRAGDMAPP